MILMIRDPYCELCVLFVTLSKFERVSANSVDSAEKDHDNRSNQILRPKIAPKVKHFMWRAGALCNRHTKDIMMLYGSY